MEVVSSSAIRTCRRQPVVTKVQFTVYDTFSADQFDNCLLGRAPLAAGASGYDILAQVPSTGPNVERTPGRVRLTDKTINDAPIDNTAYGYWL
jgi:hypothetical protein